MSASKIVQIITAPAGMTACVTVSKLRNGEWGDRDRETPVACLGLCEDGSIVGVMLNELERPRRVVEMVEDPKPDLVWEWAYYSTPEGSS